eukprot:840732_1
MINLAQQNTAARSTKTTNDTINNRRMLIQRSVSIDEPVPSFSSPPNVSGLRITMPKRTTTTERVLPTVSELKQDDSDEKHDVTECNTNTLAWVSPDGPLSPIARDHVHTYSSDTVSTIITSPGSSADHLLAFYVPLSPINKEQELRNESYPYHACASSGDSLLSDQDIQQIMDQVIVQCAGKHPKGGNNGLPQNNKSHSNNAQNAGQHQDQSNGQNNASNNQNNNDPNDSGGSANNGGNGNEDDDDKKRDNRGKMDQNDDEEEQEEEEEEEKKEEDIPPPIRTNMIMSRSKSNGIHVRNDPKQYNYTPHVGYRAQGYIKISMRLTQEKIPQNIGERIANVYDFVDKLTGIARYDGTIVELPNGLLFNYGFHHKHSGEVLYLVAHKAKRNGTYFMKDEVYTQYQIYQMFGLKAHELPQSWYTLNSITFMMHKMNDIFRNSAAVCQQCIFKTKWHKLPVFHTMNSNKEIKEYNKQRLTFSITKTEFIDVVERFVHHESQCAPLIPVIMFNCNGYRVEYIQIVRIRNDSDIGISYVYNPNKNCIKATGIHLNRENILHQHQLADPYHDCHCLDSFQSIIDDLHIGNPDDDKNRVKDLQKKNCALKKKNEDLTAQMKEMDALKIENEMLKKLVLEHMNQANTMTPPALNMMTPPVPVITPVTSNFVALNTPSSISLTPMVTPTTITAYNSAYFTPSLTNNTNIVTPQSNAVNPHPVTFGQYANRVAAYHHCNVSTSTHSNHSNQYVTTAMSPQSRSSRSMSNSMSNNQANFAQFLGTNSNPNVQRNSYCNNSTSFNQNINKSRST